MKILAMIPARIGSKRIPKKNLRPLNGKPLIQYIMETAKMIPHFADVYLDADDEIFRPLAEAAGVKFYLRPEEFGRDTSTNDEFALDFLEKHECDVLIQLLPTSPFLTVEEINGFVDEMMSGKYETLVSVEHLQIACLYKGKPINFVQEIKNPPSQEMTPVMSYATALMGWTSDSFKKNMEERGSAYHGSAGKTGYYQLRGFATIDIDREEDFVLADAIMRAVSAAPAKELPNSEVDVPSILKKDGVRVNNLHNANREIVNVNSLIEEQMAESTSWSYRLINTDSNSMTIISQNPGEGNREHYHPDWNEWWYILDGSWKWTIEGKDKIVSKGDVVFIPKGTVHRIEAVGDKPAIRMAVSRADVAHVYTSKQ